MCAAIEGLGERISNLLPAAPSTTVLFSSWRASISLINSRDLPLWRQHGSHCHYQALATVCQSCTTISSTKRYHQAEYHSRTWENVHESRRRMLYQMMREPSEIMTRTAKKRKRKGVRHGGLPFWQDSSVQQCPFAKSTFGRSALRTGAKRTALPRDDGYRTTGFPVVWSTWG